HIARPMSTGPEVVNVDAIIRERIEARRAERASEKTLDTPRQVEVGLALLGGLGGLAIVSLLVLSPRSVDVMEGLGLALAATIGLVALALPPPSSRRVPYRLVTWLALASLVWLVDPMRLSEWTWSRQLRTGTDYQKQ